MRDEGVNALDVGRGLAVISVMYGHALAPWFMEAGDRFSDAAFLIWKFGASFMMPFFFFLSGLSWREGKSFANTVRQALALILIALIASAAYDFARLGASVAGLAPMLGGQALTAPEYVAGLVRMALVGDYYALSPLWFIVTLAIARLLAAVAMRVGPGGAVALVALIVTLSVLSIDHNWRNVYQLRPLGVGLLFFLAGYLLRADFGAIQRRPAAASALTLLGLALTLMTFWLNQGCRWDVFERCGVAWLDGHFGVALIQGQIGNLPLFAFTGLAGVGFACGLSIMLARGGGVIARRLDAWGGNSLNLLIVNALFLHIGNVLIEKWIAPNVAADNPLFFLTLLALTLIANIAAAHLLERPLRWLHRIALTAARHAVDAGAAAPAALAWALRGDRVSQRNE